MNAQMLVSENTLRHFKSTRPWVMFLAILGFVMTAFMVLACLFMFAGAAMVPANSKLPAAIFPVLGVVYLALSAFVYLIPSILLIRYSGAIWRIPALGQEAMEDALSKQKSFWKYAGILMIVILACDVLFIIGAIAFGVFFGLSHHM